MHSLRSVALTINNLPLEVLGSPGGGLVSASATALTNSGKSPRVRGTAASPPSDVMTADTYPSRRVGQAVLLS